MNKYFLSALALFAMLALSPATAAPGKVTITFWNGFTGSDGEILKTIVKDFNTRNDGKIEVKMDIMPWDSMLQKLPPSIATKTAPSLILLGADSIAAYAANQSLEPMDDFWSATGLKATDYADSVLELMKDGGKSYGVPMQTNLIYLYWNKDLFRAAGLDPNKPPKSLAEMASFAVKLTDAKKNQYGLGLPSKGAPQYWTSFFWNNGGDIYDLVTKKNQLDSPENLKTLQWMRDLAVTKKVNPKGATGPDLDNLMFSGKLGMYINGPWLVNGLRNNKVDFGIGAVPAGTKRQQIISGAIGYMIPAGSRPKRSRPPTSSSSSGCRPRS